jgi:phosphate-selective porin OprO/OprP
MSVGLILFSVAAAMPTAAAAGADGEPPAPTPAATPNVAPPKPSFVAGFDNGFTVQSETGDFVLKVTGYAQADGRFANGDGANAVTDSFLLRRVRPIVQGTVAKYFDFYLNPDFGLGTTVLQDAYLDVRFTPKLRFRAGKIKTPFGIERLESGQSLLLVERALPNNLAPNRDVGLQVHSGLRDGALAYQLAVLDGVPDGGSADTDTNDSKDLVGRVFVQPWTRKGASPLRGLGFGIAGTKGRATGALRGYTSASQVGIFTYAPSVTANGTRTRWSPQGLLLPRSSRRPRRVRAGPAQRAEGRGRQAGGRSRADELRVEPDRVVPPDRRGRDLREREAQELLRPLGGEVGRLAARRPREWTRHRPRDLQRGLRGSHQVRAAGDGVGSRPQLDLERQSQVRARLRADAVQGRGCRGRRSAHRKQHPDPSPALVLIRGDR